MRVVYSFFSSTLNFCFFFKTSCSIFPITGLSESDVSNFLTVFFLTVFFVIPVFVIVLFGLIFFKSCLVYFFGFKRFYINPKFPPLLNNPITLYLLSLIYLLLTQATHQIFSVFLHVLYLTCHIG